METNNFLPFAYVANAQEDKWPYGIKNLDEPYLYYLSIDHWKPLMFSARESEKRIELPCPCLDICSESLSLPKLILDSNLQNFEYPFHLFVRGTAYYRNDVVLEEGSSKIIKKGMSIYGGYFYKIQLFIDVLRDEILPIVVDNDIEYERVIKEIKRFENCSKDKPVDLHNFRSLTEQYLGCKYDSGSEALIQLLKFSFKDRTAFIRLANKNNEKRIDKPTKSIEEIIADYKRRNDRLIAKGLKPEKIPNLQEALRIQECNRIKTEKQKVYREKRIDKFIDLERSGLSIDDLFLNNIIVLPEDELQKEPKERDILIKNYRCVSLACDRVKKLLEQNAPTVLLEYYKRVLQQHVDVLIYNLMLLKFSNLTINKD